MTADARQMPLPDESVGVIITSPPYNVGLNYDGYEDKLPDDEFRELNRFWLTEAYRVMKDTGRMYLIVSDAMLWWIKPMAEEVGWTFVQHLIWCKPNIVSRTKYANSSDWNRMSEIILLFRRGERVPMLNAEKTRSTTFNWSIDAVPQSNYNGGRIHPAQLPISLCKRLIDRTPGEPVLDPFCGSGSVLKAAKQLGRSYIGFDLVPTVARKAAARLGLVQTHNELPMFRGLRD